MPNKNINIIESLNNIDTPVLINFIDKHQIANDKLKNLFEISYDPNNDFWNTIKFYDVQNNLLTLEELPFIKAAKEKRSIPFFRLKYLDKNSSEKYLIVNSIFIQDKSEESFVISLFSDVTKEIGIEQILKESLGSIQAVLYSTNADGSEYYFISDAVRQLFGFTPEEIYNNKFLILRTIEKEHFKNFREFIDKLRTGEASVVEYKMKDRFGKEHWVRHTGIPIIRNEKVIRVVGIILDITEEKITRLRLENSEEKFRMLIDTADDLIFILNGFGYFNMVNKNGANALGYRPEEMIGKHFLDFVDKEDESKIAEAFSKILTTQEKVIFEVSFIDRFEKSITFEIHAKPMIIDGEVAGMISIGRNITNRKLYEQKIKELNAKLIEANRIISIERERARQKITLLEELNKLKSEFVSNISHELRTPLASVVGFAETIATDSDLPKETIKEFSEIILSEGRRLAKIINDVLDFSRLETGQEELKKEEFEIQKLIDEVESDFKNEINQKELVLSKEYPQKEVKIYADRKRLKQALDNLVSNAIKYTPKGGRINLMVNDFEKEIEITVSDTGIGIPEKELPKLFQKFSKIYRPNAPVSGAGMGLAVVKQIIDLHKGVIRVKSEENKGTTFIIRLPK
ncbi:PAS domain-containing sensor histidine kinase [Rosettibacter firmus]|uniref:PAS domain-containing sensor histidine kinase n=1 Tax=Rosettibacter firmus TaxID=3111522 RepID=UPI00336C2338